MSATLGKLTTMLLSVTAAMALPHGLNAAPSPSVTFRPVPIPISEPDVFNPGRGYYNELWYEFFWVGWDKGELPTDTGYVYNRYLWSDLEPQKGVYQFSLIDRDISKAKASGRKFGFRVMPHNDGLTGVPEYITHLGGSWVEGAFWPAWDNDSVIERMDSLYARLSEKYDGDPAIGFMDFGLYGKWGEWHGEPAATLATKKKIADIHLRYWKKTRLLMQFSDDSAIVKYVMDSRPRIGARADNIGSWIFDGFTSTDPVTGRNWFAIGAIAKERWKTAPIITEWCGCGDTPERALRQVRDHHVVALGDNNILATNREIGKAMGFRFVLDSLSRPARVGIGVPFAVQSWWSNVGVTPAYEEWELRYELYNTEDSMVFSATGSLDFEAFLPGSRALLDSLTIPSPVGEGAHTLKLSVIDPSGYYPNPLALAIRGLDTAGRYPLGEIGVTGSTPARASIKRTTAATMHSTFPTVQPRPGSLPALHTSSARVFSVRGRLITAPGATLRPGVYLVSGAPRK